MNTRLKQFLAAENITQAQFADRIQVVRASVSHILAGRNNPSYDFIKAVMNNYPKLNMEWLILGRGKMYKEQPDNPLVSESMPVTESSDTELLFPETELMTETADDIPVQRIANHRRAKKIIILFDDGSFQEI